jgi:hypothetical protein
MTNVPQREQPMSIIQALNATRDETLRYFELSEAELEATYAPGKWSNRFLLHHLADGETVMFDRIRRVLSEGRKVVWAFDQDAWAHALDYASLPLTLSRQVYLAARNAVTYYAGVHYEKNGHLEWIHSETGVRTLKDEFDKIAWHNEHHLKQIRQALGRA